MPAWRTGSSGRRGPGRPLLTEEGISLAGADKKSEQVYRWLLAYIDENKFSGNLKLPSENALCRRLDISRETARSALARMDQEGQWY